MWEPGTAFPTADTLQSGADQLINERSPKKTGSNLEANVSSFGIGNHQIILMKTVCILFAVISIVVIASTFIFGTRNFSRAPIAAYRRDFATLLSFLDAYKMNGRSGFPTNEQGLKALVERPTAEPLPKEWVQQIPEIPRDPWGIPYRYFFPGTKNPNEPEIISAGPDGIFDTEDDLSSQD